MEEEVNWHLEDLDLWLNELLPPPPPDIFDDIDWFSELGEFEDEDG